MLRNNADARRCSYFELGLPVREHEAVRLYELTSGMEFHEVDASLAKTVNHIKY